MTQTDQNPTTKPAQVLVPLTTPEEVDGFLAEYPQAAVFKAGTCHKTMQGFGVLETFLAKHELPVGFIRVVDWRPASNHVAELSGLQHSRRSSSFKNGQPTFEVNNWDITPEALGPVFEASTGRDGAAEGPGRSDRRGNVAPYKPPHAGVHRRPAPDWEFQERYVNMFRDDASLRSQREFELLSRLFGDPDAYHGGLHQLGQPQGRGDQGPRRGTAQPALSPPVQAPASALLGWPELFPFLGYLTGKICVFYVRAACKAVLDIVVNGHPKHRTPPERHLCRACRCEAEPVKDLPERLEVGRRTQARPFCPRHVGLPGRFSQATNGPPL